MRVSWLVAWCGLAPGCLGYSQFRKYLNEQFFQALPLPLQRPSREAWRLLSSYSFLHIDEEQDWDEREMARFGDFANQLEKILDELPNYPQIFSHVREDNAPPVDFDALPIDLRGLLYLFQVGAKRGENQILEFEYGEYTFLARACTVEVWWDLKRVIGRLINLKERLYWIHFYVKKRNFPLIATFYDHGKPFQEAIYGGSVLLVIMAIWHEEEILSKLEELPSPQFEIVERDMLQYIKDVPLKMTTFREVLLASTPTLITSSEGPAPNAVLKDLNFMHKVYGFLGRTLSKLMLMRFYPSCTGSDKMVGEFGENRPTERQVRFVTLMNRLLLLHYNEVVQMITLSCEHRLQLAWDYQRQCLAEDQKIRVGFTLSDLEDAYTAVSNKHASIMCIAREEGIVKDSVRAKGLFSSMAELLEELKDGLADAYIYAVLHSDLYDLSLEPEPEAQAMLTKIHEMAVGTLRLLDELLGVATQLGEEYETNDWLLFALFGSGCNWLDSLAILRVLVPRFEAKLRMPEADTYKFDKSPLNACLSHISIRE